MFDASSVVLVMRLLAAWWMLNKKDRDKSLDQAIYEEY